MIRSTCIAVFLVAIMITTSLGQQLSTPYRLTPDKIGESNNFKLQCQDSNGLPVSDAAFFRNGVLNTTDDCFSKLISTGTDFIQLTLTSECDGQFMCGTSSGNGYMLSGPTEVRG